MLSETYEKWQKMQPLTDEQRQMLRSKFMVEYNYNSNHMEGNTLTYGQTELLLMFGKVVGGGPMKDFMDMRASEAAVKMIEEEAESGRPLTQNFMRTLHKTLLREDYEVRRSLPGGVITSYVIHAGRYKTRPNSVITRSGEIFEYASPEETPAIMGDLTDWYNSEEKKGELQPEELAALFHYRYIRIHPFEDGNGRIARLLVNFILLRMGRPMIVVRSRLKDEYLTALEKTDRNIGPSPSAGAHATRLQAKPFLAYFKKLVQRELQSNIDFLTGGKDSWWYDGERIMTRSPNAAATLATLRLDPGITIARLAETIGINKSAMQKLLKTMEQKGYISRSDGGWIVFATCPVN